MGEVRLLLKTQSDKTARLEAELSRATMSKYASQPVAAPSLGEERADKEALAAQLRIERSRATESQLAAAAAEVRFRQTCAKRISQKTKNRRSCARLRWCWPCGKRALPTRES